MVYYADGVCSYPLVQTIFISVLCLAWIVQLVSLWTMYHRFLVRTVRQGGPHICMVWLSCVCICDVLEHDTVRLPIHSECKKKTGNVLAVKYTKDFDASEINSSETLSLLIFIHDGCVCSKHLCVRVLLQYSETWIFSGQMLYGSCNRLRYI